MDQKYREKTFFKTFVPFSESRGTDSSGEDDSDDDEQNGNASEEVKIDSTSALKNNSFPVSFCHYRKTLSRLEIVYFSCIRTE